MASYGAGQRLDHEKYDSMYDPTKPLTSDIPLSNRGWDTQPSDDAIGHAGYHSKHGSVSSVYTDKPQQAQDYGGYGSNTYPPSFPNYAHTQDPGPTPHTTHYYTQADPDMEPVQPHPGTSIA